MNKALGVLQKSAEVMKLMSSLVKLPEMNKAMQGMAKEMMKARRPKDTISSRNCATGCGTALRASR